MRWKSVSVVISTLFICLGTGSVFADSMRSLEQVGDTTLGLPSNGEIFNGTEHQAFGYFKNEHSDRGKHLGFSVSSVRPGPELAALGFYERTGVTEQLAVTQVPEPATMMLLSSGLLAVGAYARRIRKR